LVLLNWCGYWLGLLYSDQALESRLVHEIGDQCSGEQHENAQTDPRPQEPHHQLHLAHPRNMGRCRSRALPQPEVNPHRPPALDGHDRQLQTEVQHPVWVLQRSGTHVRGLHTRSRKQHQEQQQVLVHLQRHHNILRYRRRLPQNHYHQTNHSQTHS